MRVSDLSAFRWAMAAVFAYEAAAIVSGEVRKQRRHPPTISTFCGRHRRLIPLAVGCLAAHLVMFPPQQKGGAVNINWEWD